MEQIYLSRRNLLGLLSKLDRQKAGEQTYCTIIKGDIVNQRYRQTMESVMVTAVEDELYYTGREPGPMVPRDEPNKD
jgi:predicted MarR family transcription regulator